MDKNTCLYYIVYLWKRSKCPISINGNVIEGNEWNVNVLRKSFATYQEIIITDWDWCHLSLVAVCTHYTVSSILGWVLQHTAADLPVVASVSRVSSAVCVAGPGPAPGLISPGSHQYKVLLLIAIIAAQWLSPVCRRAIEARHYEARLRSFLLFSWNRWIIDWRIWSSGSLCLVTAALRRWGSGNTAVIAIVTETKLDLFCLYSFLRMLWRLFYYSQSTMMATVSVGLATRQVLVLVWLSTVLHKNPIYIKSESDAIFSKCSGNVDK